VLAIAATSTDDCLAALRLGLEAVAALLGAWLLAGTAASAARRAVPALRAHARLDRATLPVIRRALDVLFAASLGGGLVAGAAAAASGPDVPVVRRPVAIEQPQPRPSSSSPPPSAPSTSPPPSAPSVRQPTRHVVAPGESLWIIARAAILVRTNGAADDRDVARYWARVVAANRAHLRSSSPNLIFPGEVVELPA
jgi:nucleoid-associated protein YgaU